MDRNDASTDGMSGSGNDFGTTPNSGGNTGSLGYGSSAGRSDANSTSSSGGSSSYQNQEGAGLADRARDIAGSAQDRLADVGSTVRDKAGSMKDSLANAARTSCAIGRPAAATGNSLARRRPAMSP